MKNTLRPYKADTPEHTVQRIKDIISRHEIPVIEQALGDGDMFCSCRIYIYRMTMIRQSEPTERE